MATLILRDDVLRARHVEDDPDLARSSARCPRISPLFFGSRQTLRFRKIVDTATGQPTDSVRPEPADAEIWHDLQSRRGSMITVEPERPMPDPYLLSLSATLTEWNSSDDAAAYDGL